jgi:hypothetical protein
MATSARTRYRAAETNKLAGAGLSSGQTKVVMVTCAGASGQIRDRRPAAGTGQTWTGHLPTAPVPTCSSFTAARPCQSAMPRTRSASMLSHAPRRPRSVPCLSRRPRRDVTQIHGGDRAKLLNLHRDRVPTQRAIVCSSRYQMMTATNLGVTEGSCPGTSRRRPQSGHYGRSGS